MSDQPAASQQPQGTSPPGRDGVVYVMPEQSLFGPADDSISLRELSGILWRGKWIVLGMAFLFASASILFALSRTEIYRAELVLVPAEAKGSFGLGGQLGGLAALAGVTVGGGGSIEAVATLRSREFARKFIEEFQLLRVFFADEWNSATNQWLSPDPDDWPDIRDAVKHFQEEMLEVREDRQTGLVSVVLEWKDPVEAARWANLLVDRLNERLRGRALAEAEANVAYLREELAQTKVVGLQQSIGRLLESELQKLMLARGNEEFAFRVIDAAESPKNRARPKRTLIVIVGTMLGGMVGIFVVLVMRALRNSPSQEQMGRGI